MNILYEDNHLLVVVKPENMPVCGDESNDQNLLDTLKMYLKEKYNKPGNVYLGLVHRLDRPVSGVMVFAKTSKAASRLSDSLRLDKFHKSYLATVCGQAKKQATLKDYLSKNKTTNTSVVTNEKEGKLCLLDYQLLDYKDNLSLVKVDIHTGRSHQIRVQMSHGNLPLWGDQRYNHNAKVGQQIALFAYKLSFPHPITKEVMTFTALPKNRIPWNYFEIERLINYGQEEKKH